MQAILYIYYTCTILCYIDEKTFLAVTTPGSEANTDAKQVSKGAGVEDSYQSTAPIERGVIITLTLALTLPWH